MKRSKKAPRHSPVITLGGLSPPVSNPLVPLDYPELVFGLVGPAGTDLSSVIEALSKELMAFNYNVHEIRLSKLIEKFLGRDYSACPEDTRIENLMNDGTHIRKTTGRGDSVGILAISEIKNTRKTRFKDSQQSNAYILNSLKHPGEIETLRNVYGYGFFTISVYSPRHVRVNSLANRIARSQRLDAAGTRGRAEQLIERDEQEHGTKLGQDVTEAFPEADLFVDARSKKKIEPAIKRFVEVVFSHPFHTPTKDEYGMYHAKSAALRSADLSRQVGAVIANKDCNVIAVGCNDVPKAGGGLYWSDDQEDHRDFQRGFDASSDQKEQILAELLDRFQKNGFLNDKLTHTDVKTITESLLYDDSQAHVLENAVVLNLLEFGRSVHAEMAALMDAARRGVPVRGATLYCTTFPCHMCARHIIAAGIDRVVYIEPYPKSKAKDLYPDSIVVDQTSTVADRVNFEAFVGIAPRQYLHLFTMVKKRKDIRGKAIDWRKVGPKPRLARFINTYLQIETRIVADVIPEMMKQFGINCELFDQH